MVGKSWNNYHFKDKAVLYRTVDLGESWIPLPINYGGGVKKVFPFNDTLILLLHHISADTNYILKSTDGGKDWERILTYPKGQYVREADFITSWSGKIVIDNRNKQYLLSYKGTKWDTVLTLPDQLYQHEIFERKLVTLVPEGNTGYSKGIRVINTEKKELQEIPFDKPYIISSSTKVGEDLFLAASEKDSGKIIKFSKNQIEVIELGEFAHYIPDEIFAFENTILTVASRKEDIALLGVIHSLLVSKDYGRTWTLEELPNPLSFRPAFFYRDQFFISSALAGKFQLRK